jgi:hypothetical protein
MNKEEIKAKRIELRTLESEERSKILHPHIEKYHTLEKKLQDECEESGHYFQICYYNWGSFDDRKYTHESMLCKYCHKRIFVPHDEVDNVKRQNK